MPKCFYDDNGVLITPAETIWERVKIITSNLLLIVLILVAIFSIFLVVFQYYKFLTAKDRKIKEISKRQIKRGIIMFLVSATIYVLINLINVYFGLEIICINTIE